MSTLQPDSKRLQFRNISKSFPGVLALDDVSVDLERGEVLSIIGENGAGKSTLVKILSGSYPYGTYTGEVEIGGEPRQFHNARDAELAGVAMIYQELNIQLNMSIAENVMLGRWPKRRNGFVDWKTMKKIATETLERLKLDIDVDLPMRRINASLQQLVCIARALVQEPTIFVLDEPTAALTLEETENLMEVIRSLKADGISCIYISHKLDEVFDISDRVVIMRNGKKVSEYPRAEINPSRVIEDMIGRKVDKFYPGSHETAADVCFEVKNFVVPHPYAPHKNMIDGVDFTVRQGEILGLVGLVGSGRSELLKAIYGAMPKTSGDVFIDGKQIEISQPRDAIAEGVYMVSEDRKADGYVPSMSIRQNMTLSVFSRISRLSFISRRREDDIINQFKNYLSIKTPSLEANILTLSGGNQQKVLISRALATEMKVLFLDEPTRGIDVGAKAEVYKLISQLSERGIAIVVVSSEMPELISICDRFVVLSNGVINNEMSREEATEHRLMNAACSFDEQEVGVL